MMEEESNPFASVQGHSSTYVQPSGDLHHKQSQQSIASAKHVPLSSADPLNAVNTLSEVDLHVSEDNIPRLSTDSNCSDLQTPSSPREQNGQDDDDLPLISGMKPDAKYRQQLQQAQVHSDTSFQVPAQGVMPFFEVRVTSPRKVNDAINPYTVYKVVTKTNSTAFREREFSVTRRFRDFYWLHEQLSNGNPGVIVPPPPEKHVLGRFQDDFVESRRLGLERMIGKIMSHPHLYGDPDVKIFLESEKFSEHVTSRRKNSSKGLFQILGNVMSGATATFVKQVDPDEWFEARRNQLDQLEAQIKGLHKAIEGVSKQRKELANHYEKFGEGIIMVAMYELKPQVGDLLEEYAILQKNLKEIYDKQAQVDLLTLGATTDEYLRMIVAVRAAFTGRSKVYSTWQTLYNDLDRRRSAFPKAEKSYNVYRVRELKEEMNQLERRMLDTKHEFEEITKLVRSELDRFDREKIEDYQKGLEAFLGSMIDSQEQIIKLWEDFLAHVEASDPEAVEAVNREYAMDPERKVPEPYSTNEPSEKASSEGHSEIDVEIDNLTQLPKEAQNTNWSLPTSPEPMSPPAVAADVTAAPISDDTTTSVWN